MNDKLALNRHLAVNFITVNTRTDWLLQAPFSDQIHLDQRDFFCLSSEKTPLCKGSTKFATGGLLPPYSRLPKSSAASGHARLHSNRVRQCRSFASIHASFDILSYPRPHSRYFGQLLFPLTLCYPLSGGPRAFHIRRLFPRL